MLLSVFAGAALLVVATMLYLEYRRTSPAADPDTELWDRVISESDSPIERSVMGLARRLSNIPVVRDPDLNPLLRVVEDKLLLAGGPYGGSPQVFMAVQLATVFCAAVAGTLVYLLTGFAPVGGALVVLLSGLPWSRLSEKAAKRRAEIDRKLPEFADLLQMALTSMSVLNAMAFCAKRSTGVVAEEVTRALDLVRHGVLQAPQAFMVIAERLGTPEAKSLFTSLLQAHQSGTRVSDTIAAQAAGLRASLYQAHRARIKKIPIKLVVIIAIHLIVPLIAIALLPAVLTFTGGGL